MMKYWDKRANMGYFYKGEKFYTITAVPYYYKRRNIIINRISSLIANKNIKICDFGCGDGEYIRKLHEKNKNCTFHGVDISKDMILEAERRNKYNNITFEVSGDGINKDEIFDLVYSSAVFAHIGDEILLPLFKNIYNHIQENGMFILCEKLRLVDILGKIL
ncbi:class I SAM-dependent methyltransferase [Acetivibrio clariflavus]|uniref:class I SAM-dependent methyltransferase n=1 Tax=Acetivibrio clariflavus TaxID=288965 RepID=UPI0031F4BE89